MEDAVADTVVDFYYELFASIFTRRFAPMIGDRLKRDEVGRDIERCAGAASRSLTRFFENEQMSAGEAGGLLAKLRPVCDALKLEAIANPNIAPESLLAELERGAGCSEALRETGSRAVVRVAFHSILQSLLLVGPVMAEWQKLSFPGTFQLLNRVATQLDRISQQIDAARGKGQADVDARFELSYRDYLMQRFYRVEAGTVRMTTNMNVDLRELFVMPRVLERQSPQETDGGVAEAALMDLGEARRVFAAVATSPSKAKGADAPKGVLALEQVRSADRTILIGTPGSGKSTFLEWLQLQVAGGDQPLLRNGEPAIPLMLRMRELDPKQLPDGARMVEKATASKDVTALMPPGWLERQMKAGHVLFILDGLDETEPALLKKRVMPWIHKLCQRFPRCAFLLSSRPVGYRPQSLHKLGFKACDLLDFEEAEIAEYTRHWCTSVRLGRNELEKEAREEGAIEGEKIVAGFKGHPYIRNLARTPLMLSAICLVNYFEHGELPKDRAKLYKLCVEGLLHNWDKRRGIQSEYTMEEKLKACQEVAIAMQTENRAEIKAARVIAIFANSLRSKVRGRDLLEYIRYRTGLMIERRAGVFAFAHLTFQEYLAACAVYEGNSSNVDAEQLVREHADGRWNEVIALYCGSAPYAFARKVLVLLSAQSSSKELALVIAEAALAAGSMAEGDDDLQKSFLRRIARCPGGIPPVLSRFPDDRVRDIANEMVGVEVWPVYLSEAIFWLSERREMINSNKLFDRLLNWRESGIAGRGELFILLYREANDRLLVRLASSKEIAAALRAPVKSEFCTAIHGALYGLSTRIEHKDSAGVVLALISLFEAIISTPVPESVYLLPLEHKERFWKLSFPSLKIDAEKRETFLRLAEQAAQCYDEHQKLKSVAALFRQWIGRISSDQSSAASTPRDSRRRRKAPSKPIKP